MGTVSPCSNEFVCLKQVSIVGSLGLKRFFAGEKIASCEGFSCQTMRNVQVRIEEHCNVCNDSEPVHHLRENPLYSFAWCKLCKVQSFHNVVPPIGKQSISKCAERRRNNNSRHRP